MSAVGRGGRLRGGLCHPDSKVKLTIKDTRQEAMRLAGNMMADEVKKNNAEGKITKWILGSGPEDQFQTFINRVNSERISLKNLYIFHMDFGLDWNSRMYPEANNWHSPQGRMKVRFYGKIDPELNVPEEQRIWPTLQDLDYVDNKIEELGGVDTLWAGIGYKGLVAWCESPSNPYQRITEEMYINMKTKVVDVSYEKVVESSQRVYGGCYDMIPHQAVTIGFKSMLASKRCVAMICTGEWKMTVLRVLMFSDATLEYPCTLPYLTATYDEVAAVFRKGGYYDKVLEECYEELNVKYFGVYCDGYCGVGVQGELENANVPGADKGDAIICVPPNQSMILAVQNLGFNYSSIPYSDTYTSLQTGVVQGWCGGPVSQHYGQWLDVEDHYYDYDIWQESRHYIASMDTWNSLTEEQQQIFTDIILQEAELSITNAAENDAKYKELYANEEGYTMVYFTDEEKKAFADDCREKVWPQLNELYGEEFLTELLADIEANT